MRFFVFSRLFSNIGLMAVVCLALIVPASGQSSTRIPIAPEVEGSAEGDDLEQLEDRTAETLDSLFKDLRRQTNERAARRISKKIWDLWSESGSDSINLLMARANKAMNNKQNGVAMDLLDQIVTLAPDYAEGWNRRATLNYGLREFGKSISDIERVLYLEPRHFGALSGLAVMLQSLGKDEKSLQTWYKVLEIYPANRQAQEAVIKLEDKMAGNPT